MNLNTQVAYLPAFCSAVQGCRNVIHVASPFPAEAPEYEDEIIKPAVNGTLSVLHWSHVHRVKRVVLTSSIAAIFGKVNGL